MHTDRTRIPLRGRGGTIRGWAIVDEADYDDLSQFRWFLNAYNGYAFRSVTGPPRTSVYMHRHLVEIPKGSGLEVDHINRNKLDNRRSNLRSVSHTLNCHNVDPGRNNTSGVRGVYWDSRRGYWYAAVGHNGRKYYNGFCHETVHEAAVAVAELRSRLTSGL